MARGFSLNSLTHNPPWLLLRGCILPLPLPLPFAEAVQPPGSCGCVEAAAGPGLGCGEAFGLGVGWVAVQPSEPPGEGSLAFVLAHLDCAAASGLPAACFGCGVATSAGAGAPCGFAGGPSAFAACLGVASALGGGPSAFAGAACARAALAAGAFAVAALLQLVLLQLLLVLLVQLLQPLPGLVLFFLLQVLPLLFRPTTHGFLRHCLTIPSCCPSLATNSWLHRASQSAGC